MFQEFIQVSEIWKKEEEQNRNLVTGCVFCVWGAEVSVFVAISFSFRGATFEAAVRHFSVNKPYLLLCVLKSTSECAKIYCQVLAHPNYLGMTNYLVKSSKLDLAQSSTSRPTWQPIYAVYKPKRRPVHVAVV